MVKLGRTPIGGAAPSYCSPLGPDTFHCDVPALGWVRPPLNGVGDSTTTTSTAIQTALTTSKTSSTTSKTTLTGATIIAPRRRCIVIVDRAMARLFNRIT